MLLVGFPLTILILAIIHALFPNLNFLSSLAIAACLTSTDPIVCATIIGRSHCVLLEPTHHRHITYTNTGGKFAEKHVPLNLRHILAAESAANEGFAYPFLTFCLYLIIETSQKAAIEKWFVIGCLCTFLRSFLPPSDTMMMLAWRR